MCKCSQKLLNHAKQSIPDALKTTSERVIEKTAEATVRKLPIENC